MQCIEHIVQRAKDLAVAGQAPELEVRFGYCTPHVDAVTHADMRWTAGLSNEHSEPVCAAFVSSPHWHETRDWRASHIFMFDVGGVQHRTEVCFGDKGLTKQTIVKTKLAHEDFTVPLLSCSGNNNTKKFGVRIALATETVVAEDAPLPAYVLPERVFMYHRRTFWFKSESTPQLGNVWQYTLTRRWGGATLEAAYAAHDADSSPPVEIEIECVNIKYLQDKTVAHIAQSLAQKIADVVRLLDPAAAAADLVPVPRLF